MRSRSDDMPAVQGLRERKKAKTKAAIQQHAVRLFREQGFAATTVEQIAEAAEVSPSTVFRYFPTKEDLVTTDDLDPVIIAAFEAQPPELSLMEAWRATFRSVFAELSSAELASERERIMLVLSVPELRGSSQSDIISGIDLVAELSGKRLGRDPNDPAVRNASAALFGVMLSVMLDWVKHPEMDIVSTMDKRVAHLEAGLPL